MIRIWIIPRDAPPIELMTWPEGETGSYDIPIQAFSYTSTITIEVT